MVIRLRWSWGCRWWLGAFFVTFTTTGLEGGSYGTIVEDPGPQQVHELLVSGLVGYILTTGSLTRADLDVKFRMYWTVVSHPAAHLLDEALVSPNGGHSLAVCSCDQDKDSVDTGYDVLVTTGPTT